MALACRLVLPVEEVFTRKHASPSMCIRFSAVDFIRYAEFGTAFFFLFFLFLNSFVSITKRVLFVAARMDKDENTPF